jgi:hypothetical protein
MRLSKRSTSKAVTENSPFGPRIQRLKASAAARRATTMKDMRPPPRLYTSEHAELFVGDLYQQARNDFSVFRRIIRPNMLWHWWADELARELQRFGAA